MLTFLPHRVSVMSETREYFTGGVYTTSWVSASVEWANCQVYMDKEKHQQDKKQQYNKYVCIMRSQTNITNKNRLIFDDKILTIESVNNPTNRQRMIEVTCREEII